MTHKTFVIPGTLDYSHLNKASKPEQARTFNKQLKTVENAIIHSELPYFRITEPLIVRITYTEKTRLRDHNKVSSWCRPLIRKALETQEIFKKDSWKNLESIQDFFKYDPQHESILVEIVEW